MAKNSRWIPVKNSGYDISKGKVIFNKSKPNEKPCGLYFIESDSKNYIITNCEDTATVEIK